MGQRPRRVQRLGHDQPRGLGPDLEHGARCRRVAGVEGDPPRDRGRADPPAVTLVGRLVTTRGSTEGAPDYRDRPVVVVGGGNSAGQAALHLAAYARDVESPWPRRRRATWSSESKPTIASLSALVLRSRGPRGERPWSEL